MNKANAIQKTAKLTVPNTAEYTTSATTAFPNTLWILNEIRTYAIGNVSRIPDNWAPSFEAKTVTTETIIPPHKALKKSTKSFSDFFSMRTLKEKKLPA